jgi:hypothetical protein
LEDGLGGLAGLASLAGGGFLGHVYTRFSFAG